jgi:hypothetical protein
MSSNPYAAPKAAVADAEPAAQPPGAFVPGGRGVSAGRGWSWLVAGWALFRKQVLSWIGVTVALMVLTAAGTFAAVAGTIVMTALWPVLTAGLMIGCRAIEDGGSLRVGHLFSGFTGRFATLMVVGLLYLAGYAAVLLVIAAIFGFDIVKVLLGIEVPVDGMQLLLAALVMMALLLPAIMAVWFAPHLVSFHERGAIQALRESFSGCLRNILPFLVYGVLMLVAAFAALIPFALAAGLLSVLLGPAALVLIFAAFMLIVPPFLASSYASYRDIYFTS